MEYFPLFFNLKNKWCLVVGGGPIASRKAALLRQAGAKVQLVSPEACQAVLEMQSKGELEWVQSKYDSSYLEGKELVIAATNLSELNARIASACQSRKLPVNVVDNPELCSFIVPSIVNRDPVQIAVSTGGASPVLARLLRGRLESTIPAAYGRLAQLARDFRDQVKQKVEGDNNRRAVWEDALQGQVAELIFAGRESEARVTMGELIARAGRNEKRQGEVYLVGAGPGDPDLISFRALRLMQQADVVVYDRLVSAEVLELVRRDAERVYAGKARGDHTLSQDSINQTLVDYAKQGRRVLRLKGGDPFIFGRGGEEIETLMADQIPFQVVPGITAASGCSTYAGIPLTHRDYAQACIFVTGHLKDHTIDLDWQMLARPNQTVVVYMGLHGVPVLSEQMIAHGLPPETPVALVEKGTTQHQKVYEATLASLNAVVAEQQPKPPTLMIVGNVVKLREKLNWFHPNLPEDQTSPFSRNATET